MQNLARIISISLFHFLKLSTAVKDNISHDLTEILVFSLKGYLQKKYKIKTRGVSMIMLICRCDSHQLLFRTVRDPTCS